MGKSLIPVSPKPPLGQQTNLKYKPTFRARKSMTIVSAEDSKANTTQSKSHNIIGRKATPTSNSPVVPVLECKQPPVVQGATAIPGPSKIVHGSGGEDTRSYIYTKPRREQLTSVPPLIITSAPQLCVQMRLSATSKTDVRSDTYNGYIMPSTRVQKVASVPPYSSYSKKSIGGNSYSSYTTPKSEQPARLPQLAASKNPIPAKISSGSDIPIEQTRYAPPAPLQKTGELHPTVQEATSIYQLVASEKIEPDSGLKNGQTGLEHAQQVCEPCIPTNDGSQSVVSNTLSPRRPDQNILNIGSGNTVKCALSEAVLPAEEASKGIATAIGRTEKTEKKSAVVIEQAKDTPRLDSESNKEKPKSKKAVSDLEAPGGKGVDDVEMFEQMDSSEDSDLKSHPVGNIPVANARNAAAKFRPQAPAACNTLGQAIDQAIQTLHSNPAAGPATPKMVLDHLGFAIIGHATIHGGHRPEAIKLLIENSLLKYRQDQERKERNCAKYMQQLGGLRIQDHDMLDYRTDDAAEGPENYMMEDIEETGIQESFSQSYSHPFLSTGMTPSTSIATSTDRTNLRFVDGRFEIEDEVMEDLRDDAAQVLGMSEYQDSDDSDTPQSTRSNSPELVTDSEIFTNGMDLDDMEDLLSICKLSLSTEPCTSKEPNNMDNSRGAGFEDIQYMRTIEAGDCIMAGSTEDVDSIGAGDIIMKTDCTQGADGAGKSEDPNGSCSTKRLSDTKNVDKTGKNNTNNKMDGTGKSEDPSDTKNIDKTGENNTNNRTDSTGKARDSDGSYSTKKLSNTKNIDKIGKNNTNSKTDSTGEPKKTNELLVTEKCKSSKGLGAIEMPNHSTKEMISLESLNGVGAVDSQELDSQELDKAEELSVTEEMVTGGSDHIKEAHRGELPLGIGEFSDGENMSSPEVFDNPVSLDAAASNGENMGSFEGFDNQISLDIAAVGAVCIPHEDEEIAGFLGGAQLTEGVHDADIGGCDSSVEICGGVRDADNVEFLGVLENIVPLTVVQTTDTFNGIDIDDIVDSPVVPLVFSGKGGSGSIFPEEQPDGERVANWIAELSDEAGGLGGRRKEERERERVTANIKSLEPIYTSYQKKLKSWEGFAHSGKGWAPTPKLAVAVKASTPIVVETVIPKGTVTPTGNYMWGCIFPFICISVLLAAGGPSAMLDRLEVSASTLDPGVYVKEISFLLFLLVRISLCWGSKETIKTREGYDARESTMR